MFDGFIFINFTCKVLPDNKHYNYVVCFVSAPLGWLTCKTVVSAQHIVVHNKHSKSNRGEYDEMIYNMRQVTLCTSAT